MASLLQRNPLRRREEPAAAPAPAAPPAPDEEQERRERQEQQIRFLREQELRRARTSVPPPGR